MEHRHLWIRTPRQSSILRIRATIMRAAQEYFDTNGFIRTDPPILTPAACEGTSTLFELDYFGDPAYLTQSGQLYIESHRPRARQGLQLRPHLPRRKIQDPPPPHRVLDDRTRSRLPTNLDGLMDLAEAFITHIVTRVLEHHRADLKVIGRDVTKLEAIIAPAGAGSATEPGAPRPASGTWAEAPQTSAEVTDSPPAQNGAEGASAAHRLSPASPTKKPTPCSTKPSPRACKIENPHKDGDDFGSPDETYISSQFDRPVMVHRYPAAIKAFYMQPDPLDATRPSA